MSRRRIDPAPSRRAVAEAQSGRRRASKHNSDQQSPDSLFTHSDRKLLAYVGGLTVTAGIMHFSHGNAVLSFIAAGGALAALASLVGRSVEALGDKLGPSATGVLQTVLGNLPELFVILFSLKAGLYEVVKATLVGSILANLLLVLGLAFVVGGIKNGRQSFSAQGSRHLATMLALGVTAIAIPSVTSSMHTPAAEHERAVTVVVSLLLLSLFLLSLPEALRKKTAHTELTGSSEAIEAKSAAEKHGEWPLRMCIIMLSIASIGAAFVSEWFVSALTPAIDTLGISEAFAGLIIVAIAGNAVENVVGIQLAARNQSEYAIQVILQSPVQIAMTIAPLVALAAPLVGAATFTLVLSPLLLTVLFLATFVTIVVVVDGESTWFEGATLIALYAAIATAFWWG